MDVEEAAEYDDWARQERDEQHQADDKEGETRHDEEMRRAVEHQEAEVPPAIGYRPQLRAPAPNAVVHGDLADPQTRSRSVHDHLARELHPRHPQPKVIEHIAPERAHPAVRVVDAGVVEKVEQP